MCYTPSHIYWPRISKSIALLALLSEVIPVLGAWFVTHCLQVSKKHSGVTKIKEFFFEVGTCPRCMGMFGID